MGITKDKTTKSIGKLHRIINNEIDSFTSEIFFLNGRN